MRPRSWFEVVASGGKPPFNRPFRLDENRGRWPKPDKFGYRIRHAGPNRHERRRIAALLRRIGS